MLQIEVVAHQIKTLKGRMGTLLEWVLSENEEWGPIGGVKNLGL